MCCDANFRFCFNILVIFLFNILLLHRETCTLFTHQQICFLKISSSCIVNFLDTLRKQLLKPDFIFWVKCMLQIQQCYIFKFSWNSWCKYFKFYANISSNPQILSESLLGFMFIHNDSQINKSADVLYFINASRIDFVNTTGSINIALWFFNW